MRHVSSHYEQTLTDLAEAHLHINRHKYNKSRLTAADLALQDTVAFDPVVLPETQKAHGVDLTYARHLHAVPDNPWTKNLEPPPAA